jgi:quinol monooxygenase YgiN
MGSPPELISVTVVCLVGDEPGPDSDTIKEGASPLIIVTGNYQVPPDQRDRFMTSKREQVGRTRHEAGCLEYAFSADAEQPGLVRLIELWESMEDLKSHLEALRSDHPQGRPVAPGVQVISSTFALFEGAPVAAPWA